MVKAVVNKQLMVIYYILGALCLEAVTFFILGFGGMPQYFFYNFALIVFIAFFVYAVPNYTAQYVIYTILLLIQTLLAYLNYSLLHIFGDLFSFDMISLAFEAGAAISTSFIYFAIILQLVSVFSLIAIIGRILLSKCNRVKINIKQHYSVFSVIILIALECFVIGYYVNKRNEVNEISSITEEGYIHSDTFLMNTPLLKYSSYEKFGTFGYFTNLLVREINGYDNEMRNSALSYFNNGTIYNGSMNVDEGNNVIVVMMESLEWFGFGDGNYDPNFNNLSNELTPNVYSIIYGETDDLNDNSIIAKNFYAKSKTNISEGFGIMGSYPVAESLTQIVEDETSIVYSMPYILQDMGYTTSYLHSNEISFYNRNKTHKYLGFENVIGKDCVMKNGVPVYSKQDLKWGHWDNEEDFVENVMEYIVPKTYSEKPFYSFYLNVSSHGEYEYSEFDEDCVRYLNLVKYGKDDCNQNAETKIWEIDSTKDETDLTYTEWYTNVLKNYGTNDPSLCEELLYYQCGVVGLDAAIGKIVEQLNLYGIEDETTIVLYSDHNSYYDSMSNRIKGLPLDDFSSVRLNTIPAIISSPGIKSYNTQQNDNNKLIVLDRFSSAYDIAPTLFELLGICFNENLYLGHSIFRPADYSYEINGKWTDMVIYYSNTGGLFSKDVYTYDFETYTKENLFVNDEIIEMFNAESTNILRKINYLHILNHYQLFTRLNYVYSVKN